MRGCAFVGAVTVESFLADLDVQEIPWVKPAGAPIALSPERVFIGTGVDALEIALATVARTGPGTGPRVDDVRRLWNARWNRRAAPVALVVGYPDTTGEWKAALCGTKDDPAVLTDLDLSQVERICAAALSAPDPANAERTLHRLLVGQKDQLVPGLTNSGLFASYELRTGVPNRPDWNKARDKAATLLSARGADLIRGLGYTVTPHGSIALILADDDSRRAVAVLLDETEMFDRPATRFGILSPVALGLSIAQQQGLDWLLVSRGAQIRLYPAATGVGVGRKGQSETFTEVDLALLANADAAYLTLLFSAAALADNGSVTAILAASADHAAALGMRLRKRVYEDVIPQLAVAVAGHMGATSEIDLTEAYHRTLTILFRLLFVAYAEDRGLLPYQRNPLYTKKALKTLAREFTDNPDLVFDNVSTDRWDDLKAVWRAVDDGNREWGVPAYNGGLFAADEHHPSGRAIGELTLSNDEIGPALRALLVDAGDDAMPGPVDFRALTVREFGTIYEGLLESSLSVATTDLVVDLKTKAYLPATPHSPDKPDVRAGQVYFHNASGARKATGSYFTKSFAVEHLLDTALDPALTTHLASVEAYLDAGDDAAAAVTFFDFRVADLAMGSGHFLVAAIDRIEAQFSAFLVAHPISAVTEELRRLSETAWSALGASTMEIEIEPSALLRRQIARRCLYGLDLNPMAVELARLGIWIHTFIPGLPMSALDHGLVVGNSLTGIGTVDEVLDVLDPQRSPGQYSLFADQIDAALSTARDRLVRIGRTAEATKQEVHDAGKAYAEAMIDAQDAKYLLDAAVGIRMGVIGLPYDADSAIASGRSDAVQAEIADLDATHMPYRFPEVFLRDNPGFDVLLGNPPWEELVYEEIKFWTLLYPGLKGLKQQDQETALQRYKSERSDLLPIIEQEQADADRVREALMAGPYPGMGEGHADLYKAFCWRFWTLLRAGGRAGIVLPRGALSAAGSAPWRQAVLRGGSFADVTSLVNTNKWVFDEVHPQYSLALVALHKGVSDRTVTLRGPFHSKREFDASAGQAGSTFSAEQFASWSTGATFPMMPDVRAGEVFLRLRKHPRLDAPDGHWAFKPLQGDFNQTTQKRFFDVAFTSGNLTVYKGSSFNLWTPDTGSPFALAMSSEVVPELTQKRRRQARTSSSPYFGLPQHVVDDPSTLACLHPRIAFRDISRATDTRTVLTALIPPNIVLTNKAPYLVQRRGDERDEAYLLGVLSSIPLDWYARRYVEISLNFHILNSFPIPRPDLDNPLRLRVVEIAGRLAAVDDRFADWAAKVGVPVHSVPESDKDDLIAELDAVVALLYGLTQQDVEHVFATFHRGWAYQDRLAAVLAHYETWKAST
jgi:hypothetical protein